ncbi:hypothetical protein ASZ90_007615 [hydrocarbon metagenome]|uniref:Uncharacterized protein n=1 Tax=hydrocarbon metagenome TaxID=938273 RepID=A0A0W8FP18_9ZZZZ
MCYKIGLFYLLLTFSHLFLALLFKKDIIRQSQIPKNKMHIPSKAINLIHRMMGEMLEKMK